uniref:Uncharacterized protein n=1 Tax=Oryza nivara TaxID=4536 RepID=A0A0E0GCG9_ORYNI
MDSDEKEKKKNKQIITEKMEINRLNSTKTNLPAQYLEHLNIQPHVFELIAQYLENIKRRTKMAQSE